MSAEHRARLRTLRVLLVEDREEDAELLERYLQDSGCDVVLVRVTSAAQMQQLLASEEFDVVIADYVVPGFGAISALRLLKQSERDIPFIILSGTISDATAVSAMRAGAHDYVLKSNLARLLPAIEREIQEAATRAQQRAMGSALKAADEAIRVREARLEGIISSAMDAIISLDENQHVVVFNQAAERIFGCTAAEAIGHSLDRFIPEIFREVHPKHIRNFSDTGETTRAMGHPAVLSALRSNGEEFPIEATISKVHAGDGKLLTVILRDVTERRRTEQALRLSEKRFRSMYQNAAVGIQLVSIDGSLLMINPAFCGLLGFNEPELVGKNYKDITHPDDIANEAQHVDSMLNGEIDSFQIEKRYVRKNESTLWAAVSSSLVRDSDGEPLYRVTVIQDIAERKRAELLEEQLEQAQKLESLGQLAGSIAHDFNTLLGVILGYAELLHKEVPEDDPRRDRIVQIEASAQSGALLTKQLLAFSRKQPLLSRVIDLRQVVVDLQSMVRRLLPEDIEVVVRCADDPSPVKGDPGRLQQVVLNLATNARDAMPNGGKLSIEVRSMLLDQAYVQRHPVLAPGRYEMLAVSDTGIGMSAETIEHLFEPFFTTKPVGKGTGLGLSTVYGIVRQSGGDIWVYSEPGMGSVFKIFLPHSDETIEVSEAPRGITEQLGGNETVLLVEDSIPLRNLTREILTREGYNVLEACDGVDALAVSERYQGKIHLLLTDIVMPRMRGPQLADLVVKQRPQIAVVFLSGYTEETVLRLERTGHFTVLEKPYTSNMLTKTVRRMLDECTTWRN